MKRKFYVTGGPLEITGEAGGGQFPQKNWCEGNSSEKKNPASSGTEKKIHAAAGKKIIQISQLKKKTKQNSCTEKVSSPLPVISTLHSLIIIWRLWQRFFSWRQSGAGTTLTIWNWFGRKVCPFLFISWTLFSFARLQFPYLHWLSEDGF